MRRRIGSLNLAFTWSPRERIENCHILNSPVRLDFFQESLFEYANELGWHLRAWVVLANHYHFVAASPIDPQTLRKFLGKLHMQTAEQLNLWDNKPGRKVWFQFWDSHITFERSYLARLNYVHQNPVRHGLVPLAENYKWCSASWFTQTAPPAFVRAVKKLQDRSGQRSGRLLTLDCVDLSAQ
jgi:putative transposase